MSCESAAAAHVAAVGCWAWFSLCVHWGIPVPPENKQFSARQDVGLWNETLIIPKKKTLFIPPEQMKCTRTTSRTEVAFLPRCELRIGRVSESRRENGSCAAACILTCKLIGNFNTTFQYIHLTHGSIHYKFASNLQHHPPDAKTWLHAVFQAPSAYISCVVHLTLLDCFAICWTLFSDSHWKSLFSFKNLAFSCWIASECFPLISITSFSSSRIRASCSCWRVCLKKKKKMCSFDYILLMCQF